ncbi:MAG TPA: hypothetical protein VJ783_01090 [Pirellulales bacterium]|nr:hypothetical protein [Pirellulales bacterium]
MGPNFNDFAKMFLVTSRFNLDYGVGLMTPSKAIAKRPLVSPYPSSYKPTLRELLDAIALQTFSQWKYDPSSKYFDSDVHGGSAVGGVAIFEFLPAEREVPFEVTLSEGWKSIDKGNWVMFVPPNFPVGMDVYRMGTYSTDDAEDTAGFLDEMRAEVGFEWARRVGQTPPRPNDFRPAKVGEYDALFFEAVPESPDGKQIHWRQWSFMVDNHCYCAISTILPQLDETIYPDVEKMLASFRMKKP